MPLSLGRRAVHGPPSPVGSNLRLSRDAQCEPLKTARSRVGFAFGEQVLQVMAHDDDLPGFLAHGHLPVRVEVDDLDAGCAALHASRLPVAKPVGDRRKIAGQRPHILMDVTQITNTKCGLGLPDI
jgi:hypothetical protein